MEINDYVRTKDGKIGKYIQPELGKPNITNGISFNEGANYGKHSKDIIDLVEVGDYVNGREVTSFGYDHNDKVIYVNTISCLSFENEDIETVLTKEQFEANAYKIEKEV
jgi:hypothetical protein